MLESMEKNIFGGIPECFLCRRRRIHIACCLDNGRYIGNGIQVSCYRRKNQYANYESGAYTLRCFSKTEKVNVYRVVEGEDATAENEVLLSKNFAEANSIQIGDKIQLFDSEFTVTGFAERPDYLFMLENLSDSYHNDSEFGLVILPDAAMDSLPVQVSEYYSVTYPEETDVNAFRSDLYDEYGTLLYTTADMNRRITMPMNLCDQLGMYANMILPVIMLIVIILTAVVLKRHLQNDAKQIGVLLALGIKKSQIFRHYTVFALIPAVLGSVIGLLCRFLQRIVLHRSAF